MLNNIKSTVKASLIYSLGNLSSKLVGFVLIPLYTAQLVTQEYGMYGILEASSQIIVAIFGLGLYNAFYRWYWDQEYAEHKKSMFFTVLVTVSVVSFLLTFLLSRFSGFSSNLLFDDSKYKSLITLMLINTSLEAILILPATLLRLQQKAAFYSLTYLLKFVTNLVLTIYFVRDLNHKVEGIFEAQIIGNLVYFVILLAFIVKNSELKFSPRLLNGMLKYSVPLIFSSIVGVLLSMTDRFAIKFLTNLSDVGVYSLGFKAANTIKVFVVASINMAIWPIIFKMIDDPNRKRFYSKTMTYTTFVVVLFVLGLSFFGKEVIKVLAKSTDYWNAYSIIPIISFSVLFGMLKDVSLIGLHITKKTKIIATLIFYAFLINIVLNIIFISIFGMIGAAISTCVSQFILFLMFYFKAQKEYYIPFEIKKVAILITVSAGLIFIANQLNDSSLEIRLIVKSLLFIGFPFILLMFNFYEKIELETIKKIWKLWRNPLTWKENLKRLKD